MRRLEHMLVIGLDVGNYNAKTVTQCFVSGLQEVGKDAIFDNLITYQGRSHTLSSTRLPMQTDKTKSEEMLLLSFMAIAMELKANGVPGGSYDLALAVGLPPGFLTIDGMKQRTQDYYRGDYSFHYGNSLYDLHIKRVFVCPQDYAAILAPVQTKMMAASSTAYRKPLDLIVREPLALLFDIGGGTFDVVGLEYGRPVPDHHFSLRDGIVTAYNEINAALRAKTGQELSESVINSALTGANVRISEEERRVIERYIQIYGDTMLKKLEEHRLPIRNSYCLLLGGGAGAILDYWSGTGKFAVLDSIPEIRANAMGFEEMAWKALAGKR